MKCLTCHNKDNRSFVKRVIGILGDKINIAGGQLYINDECVDATYIKNDSFTEPFLYGENYVVSEDEVFVLGDNRLPGGSNDSRNVGGLPLEKIQVKVMFRIFPFNKISKDLR